MGDLRESLMWNRIDSVRIPHIELCSDDDDIDLIRTLIQIDGFVEVN